MTEPRFAYLGETRLTGPEHAYLSRAEIIEAALAELDRVDPHHATDTDGNPLADRDAVTVYTLYGAALVDSRKRFK